MKHFKEMLINNKSVFIGSVFKEIDFETTCENIAKDNDLSIATKRTVINARSNSLQFNNGSWLYFNSCKDKQKQFYQLETETALFLLFTERNKIDNSHVNTIIYAIA